VRRIAVVAPLNEGSLKTVGVNPSSISRPLLDSKVFCDGLEEASHKSFLVFLALICVPIDNEAPLGESIVLEKPFEVVCGV
jgi:hypothetical protein